MSFFKYKPGMFKNLFLFFLLFIIGCTKSNTIISEKRTEKKLQTDSTKIEDENIAILMDLSITMMSKDFSPNRLMAVKNSIKNIINTKKENQAFSFVVYSGRSYLLCPLTKDKTKLISAIDKTDDLWKKVLPGTNYTLALLNAINSLKNSSSKKSILMFSDGENTLKGYDLQIAIDELDTQNVILNTIIVRPKDFEFVPVTMDIKGELIFEKIKSKPVDKILPSISEKTKGFKIIVANDKELEDFDFQKENSSLIHNFKGETPKKADIKILQQIYSEIEANNKEFMYSDNFK